MSRSSYASKCRQYLLKAAEVFAKPASGSVYEQRWKSLHMIAYGEVWRKVLQPNTFPPLVKTILDKHGVDHKQCYSGDDNKIIGAHRHRLIELLNKLEFTIDTTNDMIVSPDYMDELNTKIHFQLEISSTSGPTPTFGLDQSHLPSTHNITKSFSHAEFNLIYFNVSSNLTGRDIKLFVFDGSTNFRYAD
jgi:hypothetical protein